MDGSADAAHGAAANPVIRGAAGHLREALTSLPGTTIHAIRVNGEPWVRTAMFWALEVTRDRGRELAAGGRAKR